MTQRRPTLVLLVLLLALTSAVPARADSVSNARRRAAEAKTKRAKLAAKIDAARATDAQLTKAVRDLDANIAVQLADTDSARQASAAADQALRTAEAQLAEARQKVDQLRASVRVQAIAAYVNPSGGVLAGVLSAHSLNEATRKQELLQRVVGNDQGDLERLRAAEADLAADHKALVDAQQTAATRRRFATARLVALQAARADRNRVRGALESRIKDYLDEANQMAQQESTLNAFIRSHSGGNVVGGIVNGVKSAFGLMWPASGPVTSGFGMRWGRMHQGIDIGAGYGAPIRAAKAGQVIFSGTMSGYGNVVVINHGGGVSTLYGHQSRRVATQGQSVSGGQLIGYVGNTGHSTGPHLHFEVRINGSPQNPRRYLP